MPAAINLVLWVTGSVLLGIGFSSWEIGFGIAALSLFMKSA